MEVVEIGHGAGRGQAGKRCGRLAVPFSPWQCEALRHHFVLKPWPADCTCKAQTFAGAFCHCPRRLCYTPSPAKAPALHDQRLHLAEPLRLPDQCQWRAPQKSSATTVSPRRLLQERRSKTEAFDCSKCQFSGGEVARSQKLAKWHVSLRAQGPWSCAVAHPMRPWHLFAGRGSGHSPFEIFFEAFPQGVFPGGACRSRGPQAGQRA